MQSIFERSIRFICVASMSLIGLLGTAGCSQDDGIRQYTAKRIPAQTRVPSEKPQGESRPAWFFKLKGPSDKVLAQIVPFTSLVKTLKFDARFSPLYDLPEGWTASDGPPPRYQTLKIPDTDPQLEVTVSTLPGPTTSFDQYLLANLNRWRGELGLDPYEGNDWIATARNSGELMVAPGEAWILVIANIAGEVPEQGATRTLAAAVLFPPGGDAQSSSPASPQPTAPSPLEFKTPEGWETSAGNAMRQASFAARHESGTADISVMRLPGGGDALANVNRWRGQVNLEPLTEDELKASSKEIKINDQVALYVEAAGAEQSILAAIVDDGDAKWFFKMQGPKDVVAAETAHFEEFLKSVTFQK